VLVYAPLLVLVGYIFIIHTVCDTPTMQRCQASKRKVRSSSSSSNDDKDQTKTASIVSQSKDAVAFNSASFTLIVGARVSQNLTIAPKAELVRLFRLKGHTPIQRNIRDGYIFMVCKKCDAKCSVSTYLRDAWYVTTCHEAVGKQCIAGMVVYGGAWWCMAVHGGVWWCMVVYGGVWR
jgi:hypothetical protein